MPDEDRPPLVQFTPFARQDYDDLLLESLLTWGEAQMRRYEARIERALRTVARFPGSGRRRDELFPSCRSFPAGQHVVYYRPSANGIIISRILRGRRDPEGAVVEAGEDESG